MKLAVISCWKYRDAWHPFFALLERFWPSCPYELWLLTDREDDSRLAGHDVRVWTASGSWCAILKSFADHCGDEPILLMQEDFFISVSVHQERIQAGLDELIIHDAGCVRVCPMPGAESDYGHGQYGSIPRGAQYRISCQAAIWNARYLSMIATHAAGTPEHFEIEGTLLSNGLSQPVLAWKRDVKPWPIDYICSAISRGQWDPNAKRLCDEQGIIADWSMRRFAA